jgi:hypothetical protein
MKLEEVIRLFERLSPQQRDELLQCLLIAAPLGEEAMVKVPEDEVLYHPIHEFLNEFSPMGHSRPE